MSEERPAFEVARLDELPELRPLESLVWRPVRRALGIEAFGVNAYTASAAGDEVVEDHDELGGGAGHHEELYVVLAGRAAFTVAGEAVDAPAGTLVFVRDPAARRHAVAQEADTTVLAIGAPRGEVYRVSPWESYFVALPYARAGDFVRAAELAAEGLERHPDNAALLYNLACFEAQAGRRDEALGHLRRAFEVEPEKVRAWAEHDSDLDPIREDPGYPVR
jgi:tetratricopeptide (TPR) repeat protein